MTQRIKAEELLGNLISHMLPENSKWILLGFPPDPYQHIALFAGIADVPKTLRAMADYLEVAQRGGKVEREIFNLHRKLTGEDDEDE